MCDVGACRFKSVFIKGFGSENVDVLSVYRKMCVSRAFVCKNVCVLRRLCVKMFVGKRRCA